MNSTSSFLLRFPACSVIDAVDRGATSDCLAFFFFLLWNSMAIGVFGVWCCSAGLGPASYNTIPTTMHANAT